MKTHTELLPCPFCNGEAELAFIFQGNYFIGCTKCPVRTKALDNAEKVIDAWNTRVNKEAEFLGELEELVNLYHDYVPAFKIIQLIEQFQAEQKVSDENS